MDPRWNPYAPGAGTPPPELTGRNRLIEDTSIALDRIRNGLSAKSVLMVGNGLRNDSRTGRVILAARTVVRNEAAAKEHSARTLTALYTARPRWHR